MTVKGAVVSVISERTADCEWFKPSSYGLRGLSTELLRPMLEFKMFMPCVCVI